MHKKQLVEGVFLYSFDPKPGRLFGVNMVVVMDSDSGRAALMDCGYEDQAVEVLQDLEACGFTLEKVIVSHFHDDHMGGLKVLPRVPVYGSAQYQVTLDLWTAKEEHGILAPTHLINRPETIHVGEHRITMIPFPGHSACEMLVDIDGRFLYVSDELMFATDGRPLLPSSDENRLERHIDSLERLKQYSGHTLIPGHGAEFAGMDRIRREIEYRKAYFEAILQSSRKLEYEEVSAVCGCDFAHSEWHMYVYEG